MSRSTVLSHYRDSSWTQRFFLELRALAAPYSLMASYLPPQGRILDLGCGHGVLALTAAAEAPSREVLGIDHAPERIEAAIRAAQRAALPVRFEVGSLLNPPDGPWDAITAIDVFHYFKPEEQEDIIRKLVLRLSPQGMLMIREVDTSHPGHSRLNRWYERVSTTFGITRSNEGTRLYFRTPKEWTALFEACGLSARTEPCSHPLFADVLIFGFKGPKGAHGSQVTDRSGAER